MDNIMGKKCIWVFPNQKPWMTSQVKALLRNCNTAFRSGERALCSAGRADLKERYQGG